MNKLNIAKEAKEVEEYVIKIRRYLHEHPETSMNEVNTMKLVKDELDEMGIEHETVENGGIIGFINGEREGKTIILRADLDALEMKEAETNLKQRKVVVSKNKNAAHTCGHDGHTAMLLGAAKILNENKQQIKGKILLAFEQGEEIGGGIQSLLTRLVEIGADGVWGIHLKSDLPSGKIAVDPGPRMAGAFLFDVAITGQGGHGSRPDLAHSPIDCFNDFCTKLNSMRLTSLNPFEPVTYTVGTVHAGSAANIVPETLQFSGTARYLQYEQGKRAAEQFKRLLEKVCDIHHCTFTYIEEPVALDVIVNNEADCAKIAAAAIEKTLGKDAIQSFPAWMASEPFAFYQKFFPGVFAFVGIHNEAKGTGAEHHNPHFDLDEDVLMLGVAATVQYALDFLHDPKKINFTRTHRTVEEAFDY